jgi:hypothetical protein
MINNGGDMSRTIEFDYEAVAVIMSENYINKKTYKFKDPDSNANQVSISIGDCEGIDIRFRGKKPIKLASKENTRFATVYQLNTKIRVPFDIHKGEDTFYKNKKDWPRSSRGRDYLEDIFISLVNYFLGNVLYLSGKDNKWHHLLRSVRPIGNMDIVSMEFILDNKLVAAQGNPLLRKMAVKNDDDGVWPKSAHISRSFKKIPAESQLLWRASSLVNYGFYQEAALIAFSVLDAKIQDLIESRLENEYKLTTKQTRQYIRNISQARMNTILNFILLCVDKTSLEINNETIHNDLLKLNTKRNNIIHNGETASRKEAISSILVVASVLDYLNKNHGAKFDIPKYLLDNDIKKLWFM